ncbi:MAG: acetylxylan esterase [Fidelibacterota bacterium]|nr:MAG: acetylxylan esterase [Candidatus Neomarinimicrobiota bacterium]
MRVATAYVILALFLFGCAREKGPEISELPRAEISDLTSVYPAESLEQRDVAFRDNRLLSMRHTDARYEMPAYKTRGEWEERAAYIRDRVLVSAGLLPLPEKTPLNAKISGRIDRDDYSVEKVYFESYPGFYVTGNLYRPQGRPGPYPGILAPHGHWSQGRLAHEERGSVPGRCINFARQGYVVFSYSMVGYNDSKQLDHKFAADSLSSVWGINLLGLQLWNSIRSLDFITSLPEVDPERIAVTGASGGGTQTFMLTAVDDQQRIKAVAPVNMISAHFQGGCLCENAPGLRHEVFNVEVGGLAAPRPLLMVSCTHDWTLNTPRVEYPMMRTIYRLYGADDRLKYVQFDYPHNYNRASREAVYEWFGRWVLEAEDPAALKETPFEPEKDEDLLVFPDTGPPGDLDAGGLTRYLRQKAIENVQRYWPSDRGSLERFRDVYGSIYRYVIAAEVPPEVTAVETGLAAGEGYIVSRLLIARSGRNDWIPAIWYRPADGARSAAVVVHSRGKVLLAGLDKAALAGLDKVALAGTDKVLLAGLDKVLLAGLDKVLLAGLDKAEPVGLVKGLLERGQGVLAIDVFKTGEHVLQEGTETQRDESFRHFTTFNRTDTQERVQDILTALAFLRDNRGLKEVHLVGLEEAGAWAILAGAVAGDLAGQVVAQGANLDHHNDAESLRLFVPGLAQAGGIQSAIALSAPQAITLHNVGAEFGLEEIEQVYGITGDQDRFQAFQEELSEADIAALLE